MYLKRFLSPIGARNYIGETKREASTAPVSFVNYRPVSEN